MRELRGFNATGRSLFAQERCEASDNERPLTQPLLWVAWAPISASCR